MSVSYTNCLPMVMNEMHSSHKKRLLFVNGHLNVGGVEKSLVDLLRHLDYTKYDVDILLLRGMGDYFDQLPKELNVILCDTSAIDGNVITAVMYCILQGKLRLAWLKIIIFLSSVFGRWMLLLARPSLPISCSYDYAIAFRHDVCADFVAYIVNSNKRFCWWHFGEWNVKATKEVALTKLWNKMDCIVAVSEGCLNMIENRLPMLKTPVRVIPNMVDIRAVEQLSRVLKPNLDSKRGVTLMTITRLYVEKHVEDVPHAAALLLRNGISNFSWYIVGEGDKFEEVRLAIDYYGVQQHVFMLGNKVNPYPYMLAADIFVHPSRVESQCLSVLEAMSLRKPCIVCRSIGPSSYIHSGENGLLVDTDANSIAKAIVSLIKGVDTTQMGEKAYQTVVGQFTPEIVMNKFYSLIN